MRTSFKRKEQEIGIQRKTVTFEDPDQKWGEVDENPEQKSLSREKDVKEVVELINKTRNKKVCPGCRVWKKKIV